MADSEWKKLLAGDSWAQDGDRVDMEDTAILPVIDRSAGFPVSFSSTDTPSRQRINQVLRELSGGARELIMGVSQYDSEVAYPVGAITQVAGELYYATIAHDPASPVSPIALNQSTWASIGGRTASERTVPATIPIGDVYIDGSRADQFIVWWNVPDNGGQPITSTTLRYSKSDVFPSASTTSITYTPGSVVSISNRDSDEYWVSLRSTNTLGNSEWSAPKKVATSPLSPGRVQFLQVLKPATPGQIGVKFQAPVTNGLNITAYRVQWRTSSQSYPSITSTDRTRVVTTDYPTNQLTITGFTPSTSYVVRVVAVSNRNTSSISSREMHITPNGTAQRPGSHAIATEALSATSMRAYFNTVLNLSGDDLLFGYEFQYRKVGDTEWIPGSQNNDASLIVTGLERGASYEFQGRFRNTLGFGAWSPTKSQTPYTPPAPDSPVFTVGSSLDIVPNSLKGIVRYSMGNMTRPEVVKDRIKRTAVRWRPTATPNAAWTEYEGTEYDGLNDNNYTIYQSFPQTGNIPLNTQLDVQTRWENDGTWSAWSSTKTLASIAPPSGTLVLSDTSFDTVEGETETLNVRLSRIPIEDVTVTLTSSSSDLTVSPASLTFTQSNWNTNQAVTLTAGTDSNVVQDIATVTLASTGGLTIPSASVSVTIKEKLQLFISGADGINIAESASGLIGYGMNREPESPVSVSITRSSANIIAPEQLPTFNSSTWKACRDIRIRAAGDSDSNDEMETITFTATGGLTQTITRNVNVREVTSTNDSFSKNQVTVARGGTTTGTIALGSQPAQDVVVNLKPVRPNYISVSPETLTFSTSNFSTSQSFTVTATSDAPVPDSGAGDYITLEPQSAYDVQFDVVRVNITS